MSTYLGQSPRALLGTAFANAVELILGCIALFHGQIRIVQAIVRYLTRVVFLDKTTVDWSAQMLGSVLSNFFFLTASFVGTVTPGQGIARPHATHMQRVLTTTSASVKHG